MPRLTRESARVFIDQFRSARLAALADSESFDQVIHVVERLGSYLSKEELGDLGKYGSLEKYRPGFIAYVKSRGVAVDDGSQFDRLLTPFETLYDLVKDARNDALHQGAFARHLTKHAIELAIILEEVLSAEMDTTVIDFMVHNPLCGEHWQPVAFLRQQMLANSYSYLPVVMKDGHWRVVSDAAIATFLGADREGRERRKRLAMTLEQAVQHSEKPLKLMPPGFIDKMTSIDEALDQLGNSPILLVHGSDEGARIIGVLTAFDLL